ncbi:hypothetical protein ACP4OV_008284 [Aristida adscensionis]
MAAAAAAAERRGLPVDLLIEIIRRVDAAVTIVRCAATCKPLRRLIAGLRAVDTGRFYPYLLRGVSYASPDCGGCGTVHAVQPPSGGCLDLDSELLRSSEPVSSRDGLLVLWRGDGDGDGDGEPSLRVCNTITGAVTSLPCMDVEGKWCSGGIYRPVLFAVAGAGRAFKLLVMDVCMRAKVFSSRAGKWGPIRVVQPPPRRGSWCVIKEAAHTAPAVIGRTAHWLCSSMREPAAAAGGGHGDVFILALHANAAQATAIDPPPCCLAGAPDGSCALAATAGRELIVVAAEAAAISTWTLSPEAEGPTWSRQVVISRREIGKQLAAAGMGGGGGVAWHVEAFGESSGALLLRVERAGLVQLSLPRKEAVLLRAASAKGGWGKRVFARAWLHERNLASLLRDMKLF